MRIAIDATPLLLRSAGVKNLIYYWILHLRKLAGERSIITFPVNLRLGDLNHEGSMTGPLSTLYGLGVVHLSNYGRLPLADCFPRPRPDVFHASHMLRKAPRTMPVTTTIYDLTCWLMPEMHSRRNVAALKDFAETVVRRARGLIAISESTRADAERILGLDPALIEVIYPGVADDFFSVTPDAVWEVKQRYGLERPYALFVGTIEPRKNVPVLLDAWDALGQSEFDLVIAGPVGWADRATVARLRSGMARYLGYVAEPDLPALTAGAAVFVYPSLYEGFGLPLAQAMAAGVPVITSDVSSMPEVAGDGGLLVDPRSAAEIRGALERLLGSAELRARLGGNGAARAKSFRWAASAKRSLAFFERVAGG